MRRRHHNIVDGTLQFLRNLLGSLLPKRFVNHDQIHSHQDGTRHVVIEHDGARIQMVADGRIRSGQRIRGGRDIHTRRPGAKIPNFSGVRGCDRNDDHPDHLRPAPSHRFLEHQVS